MKLFWSCKLLWNLAYILKTCHIIIIITHKWIVKHSLAQEVIDEFWPCYICIYRPFTIILLLKMLMTLTFKIRDQLFILLKQYWRFWRKSHMTQSLIHPQGRTEDCVPPGIESVARHSAGLKRNGPRTVQGVTCREDQLGVQVILEKKRTEITYFLVFWDIKCFKQKKYCIS